MRDHLVRLVCLLTMLIGSSLNGQSLPILDGYAGSDLFQTYPGKCSDEPDICGITGGASQWSAFTAQTNGMVFLNTDGSSFDTLLGVFVDNGSNQGYASLIQIACDDNSGANGLTSALQVSVVQGVVYYIMIDGKNGAHGNVFLNYYFDRAPTISSIPSQSVDEEQVVGPIQFTVSDVETSVNQLGVIGVSSDQNLVSDTAISFEGSGITRTVTITPTPNHYGTNTITISVTDGVGNITSKQFTLSVRRINHQPIPTTLELTRLAGRTLSIPISTITQSVMDLDGDAVTVTSVSPWSQFGSASIVLGSNAITYWPPTQYNSLDRFTYTVNDGSGGVATGVVNIRIISIEETLPSLPH